MLAHSVREIVHELEGSPLPDDAPLNRAAARPHLNLLRALATRLEDLDRPVSQSGLLLVDELLTDGIDSPLYARDDAVDVRAALERCLAALDAVPTAAPDQLEVATRA